MAETWNFSLLLLDADEAPGSIVLLLGKKKGLTPKSVFVVSSKSSVVSFFFIQKMSHLLVVNKRKKTTRETKVETRREGARDDRDGRRPRRDSSRRVRFVSFLARRRLSTGRVRPPSGTFLLRAYKKKIELHPAMTAKSTFCTPTKNALYDEESNEKTTTRPSHLSRRSRFGRRW